MRQPPRLKCPACGSGNTRTMIGRASVKWIAGVAWRLHYCLVCDHRFPSVQRHPTEDDYIAADAGVAGLNSPVSDTSIGDGV